MKYRKIGNSNLFSSVLSLGGNIFGHFCNDIETANIITKAKDLGINCIDTADVYSDGYSESFIGNAIHKDRSKWIICTKVGLNSHNNPAGLGSRNSIFEKVSGSLKRLKTDYIDLYQLHNFDPQTPLSETVEAFEKLIKEGKIRHFGVSNFSHEQILEIHKLSSPNTFASAQLSYNYLQPAVGVATFPVLQQTGISALVYGALARGILSGKYTDSKQLPSESRASHSTSVRQDLTEENLKRVSKLAAVAKAQGCSIAELAIAWILQKTEIASAIIGVRNSKQLEELVTAVEISVSVI